MRHARLRHSAATATVAFLMATAACPGSAVEIAVNGSFETNGGSGSSTFSSWTVVRENGDGNVIGNFYANFGLRSPQFRLDVPAAPAGNYSAITDQSGPGRTALYQDIVVPATGPVWLNLRLLVINQANDFVTAPTLNLSEPGNQQVRVDIVNPAAPLWDTGGGVLTNVYQSQAGTAAGNGYVPLSINLQPFAGSTVRVRVAEVDTRHGLVVGVDQVSATYVPPATCAPIRPREGGASCNLDLDGDGLLTATDALVATRYLLGFRGAALSQGISFSNCALNTTAATLTSAVAPLVAASPPALDIDGDGTARGSTDGLLLLRALLGITGPAAVNEAVAQPNATRQAWGDARGYLNSACLAGVL